MSDRLIKEKLINEFNQDYADSLLSYARCQGGIDHATSAIMVNIDNNAITIRITFRLTPSPSPSPSADNRTPKSPSSSGRTSSIATINIPFSPPLSSLNQARDRLISMSKHAEQKLGIVLKKINSNNNNNNNKDSSIDKYNTNYFNNAFRSNPILSILVIFGLFTNYLVAYHSLSSLPFQFFFNPIYSFSLFIFQSFFVVKIVFISAILIHFGEGIIAWKKANQLNYSLNTKLKWTIQTIILGYPSLGLMPKPKAS